MDLSTRFLLFFFFFFYSCNPIIENYRSTSSKQPPLIEIQAFKEEVEARYSLLLLLLLLSKLQSKQTKQQEWCSENLSLKSRWYNFPFMIGVLFYAIPVSVCCAFHDTWGTDLIRTESYLKTVRANWFFAKVKGKSFLPETLQSPSLFPVNNSPRRYIIPS